MTTHRITQQAMAEWQRRYGKADRIYRGVNFSNEVADILQNGDYHLECVETQDWIAIEITDSHHNTLAFVGCMFQATEQEVKQAINDLVRQADAGQWRKVIKLYAPVPDHDKARYS